MDIQLRFSDLEYSPNLKGMSSERQGRTLKQLEQLLDVEEPFHKLNVLLKSSGLRIYDATIDEDSLLIAIADQLHQDNIVTDPQQLRSHAISYLRRNPRFDDNRRLLDVESDEKWEEYLSQMSDDSPCDQLMLIVLAEVLERSIFLYSESDENGLSGPFRINPINVRQCQLPPIHVGHKTLLNFVTLHKRVNKKQKKSSVFKPVSNKRTTPSLSQNHGPDQDSWNV